MDMARLVPRRARGAERRAEGLAAVGLGPGVRLPRTAAARLHGTRAAVAEPAARDRAARLRRPSGLRGRRHDRGVPRDRVRPSEPGPAPAPWVAGGPRCVPEGSARAPVPRGDAGPMEGHRRSLPSAPAADPPWLADRGDRRGVRRGGRGRGPHLERAPAGRQGRAGRCRVERRDRVPASVTRRGRPWSPRSGSSTLGRARTAR